MPMTPLPTPPSRNDPTNFAARGDAFLGALPTFQTEANALELAVDADAVAAAASAGAAAQSVLDAQQEVIAAENAAAAAAAAANYKGEYSAGTTYQVGQSVSSGGKIWIAKTINLGITPVEGANWMQLKTSSPPFQDPIVLAQVQAISLSF